ncbi:hypothetical protein JW698_03345 [Candidatus Wolfebacteria bacterium]|nr:hypothetical protein [Candidatus Wolfebacteria bacterium]
MAFVKPDTTIKEYQAFIKEIYGLPNDRYFNLQDMIVNMERFATRGLKGIRKENKEKTKINLLISFSWFISITNQLHIDIEEELWKRFPYVCFYCASCPCVCGKDKGKPLPKENIDLNKKPKTLSQFQAMFEEIYPSRHRTLEHSGVHFIEEIGEFSEALLRYRSNRQKKDFKEVETEAADLASCCMEVFSSLGKDMAKELSKLFSNNCHICHKIPCECNFKNITDFES